MALKKRAHHGFTGRGAHKFDNTTTFPQLNKLI